MNIITLQGPETKDQYQQIDFRKKGGMGEIYSATDISTGNDKAIKIIPIGNDHEYDLLKSEFDISIALKHPNIVETNYYGEFESKGVRYLYSVMNWYGQGSLRDLLSSRTEQFTLSESLSKMMDLAVGLEFAHKKVVHRDLKPENILLGDDDKLQLCDFGLAKLIDAKTRTKSFKGLGTLPYMSPECWMFDTNTAGMDIYSLGIIFYEILTLKMPYTGCTENEFREKHLYDPLPNISNERVDLPIRLVEMINKMTNKRPRDRYTSMGDVIEILDSLSQNNGDSSNTKTDALLSKAHQKITEAEKQQLKIHKEQQLIETKRKLMDVAINALFDKFNKRIEELNGGLERDKIRITRNTNQFTARFMDKGFGISFYPRSDIPEVLRRNKEASLQFQKQQYGMVIQSPQETNLEKDNVILIGQASLDNQSYDQASWGYNLLLRKADNEDLYGEWWLVWFDDSALANKRNLDNHYAIGIPEFYQEYEYGRGRVTHIKTMGMNTLESEGVDNLIGKILE